MENNHDMTELRQTGIELWLRAESWKKALMHIERLNQDPVIARYIKRTLNQDPN